MNRFLLRASIPGAVVLTAFSAASPQQGNQTQRFPQFENDEVKVWKSTVMPNTPLAMHRHEHGRVIITLRGGTENGDETILRQNVAEIRASNVSLMPEGLEQSMSRQEIADVIAYLRAGL